MALSCRFPRILTAPSVLHSDARSKDLGNIGDQLRLSQKYRSTCIFATNLSVPRTLDPTDLGFEEALSRPKVEVTLKTSRAVEVRPRGSPAGTPVGTLAPANPHHDALWPEGHASDGDSVDGDDAIK